MPDTVLGIRDISTTKTHVVPAFLELTIGQGGEAGT